MKRNIIDVIIKLIMFSLFGMAGCGGSGRDNGTISLPPALTENTSSGDLTASAGSAVVSISPSGNTSYTVQGSGMDGVAGIQLDITYDAASLGNPTVTQGGLVVGAMFASNTSRPGVIKIAIIRSQPISGSGQLAFISFATKTGSGGITSITTSMIDSSGTAISAVSQAANSTQTTTSQITSTTISSPLQNIFQVPVIITSGITPNQPAPTANIVLSASMGNVTFKHITHTVQLCNECHNGSSGDGKIIGIGKDWAHVICKGCHANIQKGPTSCKECHISTIATTTLPVQNISIVYAITPTPITTNQIAPTTDIFLPASMGSVTFKHATHTAQGCNECHIGNSVAGKIIGIGKDWAHATCKGCHSNMQKGPTSCKECHKNQLL